MVFNFPPTLDLTLDRVSYLMHLSWYQRQQNLSLPQVKISSCFRHLASGIEIQLMSGGQFCWWRHHEKQYIVVFRRSDAPVVDANISPTLIVLESTNLKRTEEHVQETITNMLTW